MKEHFQDQGVRKWAGDDLIELQSESLAALQGLVEPYAPCIVKGCEVSLISGSNYKVAAGLAALPGNDHAGVPCVKIVRVEEIASTVLPVYLSLAYTTETRVYSDNKSKDIAHDYVASVSTVQPENGSYLIIGKEGGPRLVDTLGISAKLDREDGEAKDVKVTFAQASSRTLPESGSKLGIIIGIIRKWFADLKALAFKDKVAEADLESTLATKINNKVDKETGKGLSENDFTDSLKVKLDGIATGAEVNVQADWNETSDSSDAFIRNKPSALQPNGNAGGDLSGTYPNPSIKTNVNLSGSPTTTTPAETDNSTRIATTAFVQKGLDKKLSLSGGQMTGAIRMPTTSGTSNSGRYISSGGGYGKNVGKNGLKVLCQEQSDCEAGLGADLTGYTYETALVAGQNPSNANHSYITFAKHKAGTSEYTRLAEIDGSGNLKAKGSIYAQGSKKMIATDDDAGGDLSGTYPNPSIKTNVNLSGSPTTTTPAETDNSTRIATTAFVQSIRGLVETKVAAKTWFTDLDGSSSTSNPARILFNATNSKTLYDLGVRAGDLLFYNIGGSSLDNACIGKVYKSSASSVEVLYHHTDPGDNEIVYGNKLFGRYSLPAASSSTRGGIKTGFSSTANNRAVLTSSEEAYVNIPNATSSTSGLMSGNDKGNLDGLMRIRVAGVYQFQANGSFYAQHGISCGCRAVQASTQEAAFRVTVTGGVSSRLYYPFVIAPLGYTAAVTSRTGGGGSFDVVFTNKTTGYTERPNSGMLLLIEVA